MIVPKHIKQKKHATTAVVKETRELFKLVNDLKKLVEDFEVKTKEMTRRREDLEYFRDNAKGIIDIQDIQES